MIVLWHLWCLHQKDGVKEMLWSVCLHVPGWWERPEGAALLGLGELSYSTHSLCSPGRWQKAMPREEVF